MTKSPNKKIQRTQKAAAYFRVGGILFNVAVGFFKSLITINMYRNLACQGEAFD